MVDLFEAGWKSRVTRAVKYRKMLEMGARLADRLAKAVGPPSNALEET